jgi:hypothetical protein
MLRTAMRTGVLMCPLLAGMVRGRYYKKGTCPGLARSN